MKHSVELKAETANFKRTSASYNYDFLLAAMQRHIDDHRVEQNRKAQMQSYKGAQEPGALVTTPKPKSGNKPPTSTTLAGDGGHQSIQSPHPCFSIRLATGSPVLRNVGTST
jgi:hypothetical protein